MRLKFARLYAFFLLQGTTIIKEALRLCLASITFYEFASDQQTAENFLDLLKTHLMFSGAVTKLPSPTFDQTASALKCSRSA